VVTRGTLVLNLTTLADIYLGTIDNWNHSAIRELNLDLAGLLPNAPILVFGAAADPRQPPSVEMLLSRALNQASHAFNTQVGNALMSDWPVFRTSRGVLSRDALGALEGSANSLAVLPYSQVRTIRTAGFADLINVAGNRVSPSLDAINSAISDFADQPNTTAFVLGTPLAAQATCVWPWRTDT
jgi:ABC-type phosphate transport system substrate-binding protein